METERQIIRTYSRRKPLTSYTSRAFLVPSHPDPTHVRESRLNDKTLVVDNFDDTFDRLTSGVVVPSPENSLHENGVARRKDNDTFEVFKIPLQAKLKKYKKPKQKEKPMKKDLVSKAFAGVKRKKIDAGSDDFDLSDQEEERKKQQGVSSNKKPKEKVKRVVKKKKALSPAKIVMIDELLVSESADENASNNAESNQIANTETSNIFKKPKERSDVEQHKSSHYFQASTPRVDKTNFNMSVQNISPVVMSKSFEKEKDTLLHQSVQEVQAENAATDEHDVNENVEDNQGSGISQTDNFVKPRELLRVSKTSINLMTSTPTMNKVRMPVNFQHLSPIISSEEQRISDDSSKKSSTIDTNVENDQNIESYSNKNKQVSSEQVKPSIKLSENQHSDDENKRTSGNDLSESTVSIQDDLLEPHASVVENVDLHAVTRSFAPSPLLFDDSEFIQNEMDKSKVVSEANKVDVQINFSQSEKNKELVDSNDPQIEPATGKDKNFDASNESSFYPEDWTNDYDSTYGYDQHKTNLEKNKTADSKLGEDENKNTTSGSEKTNTAVENVTQINEILNTDNTEIQSVENHVEEKSQDTIHDEDNAVEDGKNESDEYEEHPDLSYISNDDDHDSTNAEKDNFEKSQIIIEKGQSNREDKSTSLGDESDKMQSASETQSLTVDLSDQSPSLLARPLKRRKTDETDEIMIFDKVEDDQVSVQKEKEPLDVTNENTVEDISASEDTSYKNRNSESTDNINLAKPVQYDEIIKKEVRLVLTRVNHEIITHNSSREKPKKRESVKHVPRKSKETADESLSRLTRRSVTENIMKQLYEKYQCKALCVSVGRLDEQKMDSTARRGLKRKSKEINIAEDKNPDRSLTSGGLSEFLSKFNDPMKVAIRRKTQKKFDRPLAAITEDQAGQNSEIQIGKKVVTWGNDKRITFDDIQQDSEDTEDNDHRSQPIYLKPGKSWARSLSIINHFHNGKNLDELAAGRENWRHSVQTVLNMQPEVPAQGHLQNHEERVSRGSRASSQRQSKSMRKSSIATNSRFSMRIIPSGKRSTLTNDLTESQRVSYVSDRLSSKRASRKTSLKIRRDTLIETEDDLIRSAKDIILKRCKQTSYEPFDICFPDSYIKRCRKIGEGVYGEVFLYENGSEKSVIKIIPIEGDQHVNCEPQKKFHEILSEIIIAEELHKLRNDGEFSTNGFVEVNRIMCVIGKYPEKLIDLWYAYDEQKQSENDCPSMFEKDQLYIILELAHGGQDLEAYTFQNASESYAIFLQTALTLAIAEQSLEFEHRDLHWGNLLISKTADKHSTYKLGSEEISLATKGVKVAVIDFTLSRMSYQGCKIFNDLAADPTLFEAQGEYQFEIYRLMRDNVNDDWQQFNPFTNVLWMDYTLDKMITAVKYKKKTTKIHKTAIEDMKTLRKEILNYSSAFDFVSNCENVKALFDSI